MSSLSSFSDVIEISDRSQASTALTKSRSDLLVSFMNQNNRLLFQKQQKVLKLKRLEEELRYLKLKEAERAHVSNFDKTHTRNYDLENIENDNGT